VSDEDGDLTATHSHKSVESHAESAATAKTEPQVEKCPDEAENCLEKWRQEEEAAARAAAGETVTAAVEGAAGGVGSATNIGEQGRESTVRGASTLGARESAARESTLRGNAAGAGRESMRTDDDKASVKSNV